MAESDPRLVQVVGRHLDIHLVAHADADEVLAHLARNVGQDLVPSRQRDAKHRPRQNLRHGAGQFDRFFFSHATSTRPTERRAVGRTPNSAAASTHERQFRRMGKMATQAREIKMGFHAAAGSSASLSCRRDRSPRRVSGRSLRRASATAPTLRQWSRTERPGRLSAVVLAQKAECGRRGRDLGPMAAGFARALISATIRPEGSAGGGVWRGTRGLQSAAERRAAWGGHSIAARTSRACVSGFTFGQIFLIRPSGPIKKVTRCVPLNLRPRKVFSPQTP